MGATIDFAAFRTFVTFTHLISLHSTLPRGQLFVVGYQLRRISAYPKAATSEFTGICRLEWQRKQNISGRHGLSNNLSSEKHGGSDIPPRL
jgi:hypothetical protein